MLSRPKITPSFNGLNPTEFVAQKAHKFFDPIADNGSFRATNAGKKILEKIFREVAGFHHATDKITFINVILERNAEEQQRHAAVCPQDDDEECTIDDAHQDVHFYLIQELERLGVQIRDDVFTPEEKTEVNNKLDEVLKVIQDQLSAVIGNQTTSYQDNMERIDILEKNIGELRSFLFLGKKPFYELMLGKLAEMVTSGVISETVAKQLVEAFGKAGTTKLLGF